MKLVQRDDQYVLNHCTKFLARRNTDSRHDFGQYAAGDPRARICEAWRFPVIDTYAGEPGEDAYAFNKVTFVYAVDPSAPPAKAGVIGTFSNLYDAIPLEPVRFLGEDTRYLAVSVRVPKAQVHRYKFIVDGTPVLDPINPQRVVQENGEEWSRFFTHLCTSPLSFETWQYAVVQRLVDHIMPFRTDAGQLFLQTSYDFLDQQDKEKQYAFAYRLDESIGVVNFIDNLLAREERHHLIDYQLVLPIVARILRAREPGTEPGAASKEVYIQLYSDMASGKVDGWDYTAYANPAYFLQILRRHAYTGAFSHPKYGGNVGALGWRYLGDRFKQNGTTQFDWQRSIEPPLGVNPDYRG